MIYSLINTKGASVVRAKIATAFGSTQLGSLELTGRGIELIERKNRGVRSLQSSHNIL